MAPGDLSLIRRYGYATIGRRLIGLFSWITRVQVLSSRGKCCQINHSHNRFTDPTLTLSPEQPLPLPFVPGDGLHVH